MLQVKKFSGSVKEILPLADIYMRSYNELSKQYKSHAEMQLYTKGSFIKKLKTWAEKQKQGDEPFIFVLYDNEKVCGVMRLNKIPEDYKNINNLEAIEDEHALLDGWTMSRKRKIKYLKDPQYTENTLILNQIYLEQQSMYQECLDLIKNSLEELLIEAIDQPKGEVITCNQEKNI